MNENISIELKKKYLSKIYDKYCNDIKKKQNEYGKQRNQKKKKIIKH